MMIAINAVCVSASFELGCAQERQQESHKVDNDHVDHHEKCGQQDRPQKARLLEHSRIVSKSHKLFVADAVPVREGIKQSQEQGNDDRHDERKQKREQKYDIDQRSVVFERGQNIHAYKDAEHANDKKRTSETCLRAHKVERQRRNYKDRAADQADQGNQLLATGSFTHKITPSLTNVFRLAGAGRLQRETSHLR